MGMRVTGSPLNHRVHPTSCCRDPHDNYSKKVHILISIAVCFFVQSFVVRAISLTKEQFIPQYFPLVLRCCSCGVPTGSVLDSLHWSSKPPFCRFVCLSLSDTCFPEREAYSREATSR